MSLPALQGCGRVGLKLLNKGAGASADADAGWLLQPDGGAGSNGDAGVDTDAGSCLLDQPDVVPPPLPAAHWKLDETAGTSAAEATGSAPAGVLTNFAAMPAWVGGQVGGALSFDGVDDYVQVGALAAPVKTLAFWARPGSLVASEGATGAVFPSSTGPKEDWDTPEKAFTEGNGNATANLNLIGSREQHWGGFHLPAQLPAGAVVVGITVTIKSATFGVVQGLGVELSWDAGNTQTDARYGGAALVGSNNLSSYGGPDQLWGRSWQAQDFTDANFRVRVVLGGLVSLAASIDYITVQLAYTNAQNPRNVLNLSDGAKVEFADAAGAISATNWPGAMTYVNGVAGARLGADWNHVLITSSQALGVTQLQLGDVKSEAAGTAFQGTLDDVMFFAETLTATQAQVLAQSPECGL
ncbi:MAG: hypothetical protein QM778_23470 [Myxococcales bacterium]